MYMPVFNWCKVVLLFILLKETPNQIYFSGYYYKKKINFFPFDLDGSKLCCGVKTRIKLFNRVFGGLGQFLEVYFPTVLRSSSNNNVMQE